MEMILDGVIQKNETRHILQMGAGRIRAKTAWDADTLRGDFADVLILDEFQLMKEDTWQRVGAPMMLDTDGTAIFSFTPPSVVSSAKSKARDPRHANKLYERALSDDTGRWEAFTFTSMDNPHLSEKALDEIAQDMTESAYRQEILAEDVDESGGTFSRDDFEIIEILPEITAKVRKWDLAGTKDGGDYTVGLLLGRSEDYDVVLDVRRGQWSPYEVERMMKDVAAEDGPEVSISLNQDPGQAGKSQAQHLIRMLSGFDVHARIESGSKEVRANPVAAQSQGGNVKILRASWNEALLSEIELFPVGYYDDQIDALSGAFEDLPQHDNMILFGV